MNKDRPSVVGKRNKKMLEVLLASVYSPVLFRCRKLLGDEQEAKQAAETILTTLAAKRELLDDPDRLPQLLGQITAVCCMRARREMARRGVSGGADSQKQTNSFFPSKSLNSVQTAEVVLLLADALPDEERLCFYLHDLCGLSEKAISRLNGSSQERVQSCLHTAQRAISHQMKRYQEQGVVFAPFDSTQKLLNRFLSSQRSPEAAMVAARVLAAEAAPQPPRPILFPRPRFAAEALGLTAAQKGTALHLVMQFIDFDKSTTKRGAAAEIQRLVREAVITPQQGEAADPARIAALFSSPLGRELLASDTLQREFKFSILVPARDYYPQAGEGEEVLLQGVVDCWFETLEGITVVDFKTDRITVEDLPARAESYRSQLTAYSRALEEVTGRPVVRKVLWFFRLDRAVEL